MKSATDHLASATIDLPEQADSLTLLMSLLTQIHKFRNGLIYLLNTSHPSSVYTMMAVNVLRKSQREKETTPEIMGLFSKLLRSDSQFEIIQILRELWVSEQSAATQALPSDTVVNSLLKTKNIHLKAE